MDYKDILNMYDNWVFEHQEIEETEERVDGFLRDNNIYTEEYCICGDITNWDMNKNICKNCNKKIPNKNLFF